MADTTDIEVFLAKAEESLAGAESEFAAGRYNNCANRCYYSCFQAVIAAFIRADIGPRGGRPEWGHGFVHSQFVEQLINRRKEYPGTLRDLLPRIMLLRHAADYDPNHVGRREVARALRQTHDYVEAVRARVR